MAEPVGHAKSTRHPSTSPERLNSQDLGNICLGEGGMTILTAWLDAGQIVGCSLIALSLFRE